MKEKLKHLLSKCSHEELVLMIEQLYISLTDWNYFTLDQDEQAAMVDELLELRDVVQKNFKILND